MLPQFAPLIKTHRVCKQLRQCAQYAIIIIRKEVARLRAGEIIRKMKKQGWYKLEEGTNHAKWTHDKLLSRAYIPVPRHDSQELSSGVENEIMKCIKEVERNIKEADADD
jgi:predicted RNA binding protein YcfA (HicA-like mRNA interferase family)